MANILLKFPNRKKVKLFVLQSKTRIIVLHMKEIIYTVIFLLLGILLIVLLASMFLPGKSDKSSSAKKIYTPGVYTSALT